MSHPSRDVPASQRTLRITTPRQNEVGDLVVSDGLGEVVLLPRLWGFALSAIVDDRIELSDDSGLVAIGVLDSVGDARLVEVGGLPVSSRVSLAAS